MRRLRTTLLPVLGSLTILAGSAAVSPTTAVAGSPQWAGTEHRLSGAAEVLVRLRNRALPAAAAAPTTASPNQGTACKAEASPTGNVQVNCVAEDGTSPQNTESETSVAVHGSKVVVGFNDSLVCCNAINLSGYSVSTDGGKTFTDKGDLPWSITVQPFGDPAVVADGAGNFYYASLALGGAGPHDPSLIAFYKMSDGSNSFKLVSVPVNVGDSSVNLADKAYLAVAPDGAGKRHFYLTWTSFTPAVPSPIMLTDSTDGVHWRTTRVSAADACAQGSNPVPHGGTLYVSWLQWAPVACTAGNPNPTANEMMATLNVSSGAVTAITTIAPVVGSGDAIVSCNTPTDFREVIETAPGHDIRVFELPTSGIDHNGTLYTAWQDRPNGLGGGPANATRIFLSYSLDGNKTWSTPQVISGANPPGVEADRFQPWIATDATGVHAMWYERVAGSGEDRFRTDKQDLTLATATTAPAPVGGEVALSTVAFPMIQTNPNQDPIISNCYMGDYNNIVSSGTTRYVTWGDNRNAVATTQGVENQPDVFLERY